MVNRVYKEIFYTLPHWTKLWCKIEQKHPILFCLAFSYFREPSHYLHHFFSKQYVGVSIWYFWVIYPHFYFFILVYFACFLADLFIYYIPLLIKICFFWCNWSCTVKTVKTLAGRKIANFFIEFLLLSSTLS